MSFAHLLRNNSEKGKYSPDGTDAHDQDDTESEQRVKGDDDNDVKAGKYHAAHAIIQAIKEGDHEALSGSMEDWHQLHSGTGPEASKYPDDTGMSKDESKYKDARDHDD